MLEELMKQVRRLFSSKNNGGKLVYKLTDRLHYYKQTLLATCIVLLIGYSQFRDHFKCQGSGTLNEKTTTVFCLTNGTATLDVIDQSGTQRVLGQQAPHVGLNYMPTKSGQLELITHNYMSDLWAILIAMVICSFIAQRSWASIFRHEILVALLKLPGNSELPPVKRAQESRPYEKLRNMAPRDNRQTAQEEKQLASKKLSNLLDQKNLFLSIEMLAGDANECNKALDYYPNQLIYLLLANKTSAYKLAGLRLRRRLLNYSILSFSLTLMQFVLPWLSVGNKYTLYGLQYANAWLRYTLKQLIRPRSDINSIDYGLSSRIWPTSTMCQFSAYGNQGTDLVTVQCTSPINALCGKLFVIIWWFVAVNIVIELYSLAWILCSSINFKTIRWFLGRKSWPGAQTEAQQVASFRYQRALFLEKQADEKGGQAKDIKANGHKPELSELEKKKLEAEGEQKTETNGCGKGSLGSKKWYLWCSRDICMFFAKQCTSLGNNSGVIVKGNKSLKDLEGFRELEEDPNIYFLLHLLYRRFNCSRQKTKQVIKMTSSALTNYLLHLRNLDKYADQALVFSTKGKLDMSPAIIATGDSDESRQLPADSAINIKPSGGTTVDVMM